MESETREWLKEHKIKANALDFYLEHSPEYSNMYPWINCNDGIPLPSIPVLVIDEFNNVFVGIWNEYEGWNSTTKITHWITLPEPPEEN